MSCTSTAPQSHPNVSVLSEVFAGVKEDTKRSLCAEVSLLADTELDSLELKIAHKLVTNQNLIIISQSSSTSSSSSASVAAPQSCLNMTELRRLLEEEKEASKVSFRADLNRRVESLVESLYKRMTNKWLDLDLARLDSGNGAAGGDRAQAVDSADGRTESTSHPPRVSHITHSPTCSSSIGQSCPFKSQPMGPVCNCPHPPKRSDVLPEVKEEEEDTSKMNSSKDINTRLMVSKVKEEDDEDDHSQVDGKRYEVTQSNLDQGQLLSNPSRDSQNASNSNESIEESGTNLSREQQTLNTLNEPNERTVAQSADLFSPSTSTGLGWNRTALNQQATASTGRNGNKRKQPTSKRSVKRSKKTIEEDDGEDGDDIANEDREETRVKVLHLNCTQPNCTVQLDSFVHLNDHLSTVHRLAPLRCFATSCNSRFDNSIQIHDHMQLHHSQDTRFLCAVCPKEFDSQNKAYNHWYQTHLTGQFQCNFVSECAQVSDTRAKMSTHQHVKHYYQSKHFPCTQPGCTASFTYNAELKRHELTHLATNQFHCNWPHCSKQSKLRANLVKHIRMQHFGLPSTMKEQKEKNIVDLRDPNEYVRVVVDE